MTTVQNQKSPPQAHTARVGSEPPERFIERSHRTLLEEHLRIQGRTKWSETVEADRPRRLPVIYNTKRPHQGRGMDGRVPYEMFKQGLPRKTNKNPAARTAANEKEEVKSAA